MLAPIVREILAASAPAYQVLADRITIHHLDFNPEENS
jgi:hypothetical protein